MMAPSLTRLPASFCISIHVVQQGKAKHSSHLLLHPPHQLHSTYSASPPPYRELQRRPHLSTASCCVRSAAWLTGRRRSRGGRTSGWRRGSPASRCVGPTLMRGSTVMLYKGWGGRRGLQHAIHPCMRRPAREKVGEGYWSMQVQSVTEPGQLQRERGGFLPRCWNEIIDSAPNARLRLLLAGA